MTQIITSISASSRDANSAGSAYHALDGAYFSLGIDWTFEYVGGFSFQLNVPKGATINSSKLTFACPSASYDSSYCYLKIYVHDVANSDTFSTSTDTSTGAPWFRSPLSSSYVTWNDVAWTVLNSWHDTPDVSTLVQSIVNKSDWNANNYITFIIKNINSTPNDARKYVSTYENTGYAPQLTVDYTNSTPSTIYFIFGGATNRIFRTNGITT